MKTIWKIVNHSNEKRHKHSQTFTWQFAVTRFISLFVLLVLVTHPLHVLCVILLLFSFALHFTLKLISENNQLSTLSLTARAWALQSPIFCGLLKMCTYSTITGIFSVYSANRDYTEINFYSVADICWRKRHFIAISTIWKSFADLSYNHIFDLFLCDIRTQERNGGRVVVKGFGSFQFEYHTNIHFTLTWTNDDYLFRIVWKHFVLLKRGDNKFSECPGCSGSKSM